MSEPLPASFNAADSGLQRTFGAHVAPPTPTPAANGAERSRVIDSREAAPPPPCDVEHRDVEPHEIAAMLRAMLGLDPEDAAPGERAASFGRPLPPLVTGLDAGAWIAWCLVGLVMFAGGLPSLGQARHEAKRVVIVLAMLRTRGCISAAGRLTDTTRKILRENLKRLALYPWRRVVAQLREQGARSRGVSSESGEWPA